MYLNKSNYNHDYYNNITKAKAYHFYKEDKANKTHYRQKLFFS